MLRQWIRKVPALVQRAGTIHRIVGSTDVRGEGTHFAISDLGPFVLVGVARGIEGPGLPPFGRHPHAGLVAISHVPIGSWHSHSNVPGQEDISMEQGDVLVTLAGRGITHDEISVGAGDHELTQIILRLPAEYRDASPALWLAKPAQVAEGVLRLFDRDLLAAAGVDAVGYHLRIPPGERIELDVEAAHTTGFVYARSGSVAVSGERIAQHDVAVLGARGAALVLQADDNEPAECLVGLGAPIEEEWVKRLGHNGFVVAADAPSAEACLGAYEGDPQGFGKTLRSQHVPRTG